ncbi:MAG: hypothetical protein QXE05_04695 [Nitrososphaeria archaeon]
MPILIIWVEGKDSCEKAEELARKLLESGRVRGGIPLSCYDDKAMLEFPNIQQDATISIVAECKQLSEKKGLTAIVSEGIYKTVSLLGTEKMDKATILTIY